MKTRLLLGGALIVVALVLAGCSSKSSNAQGASQQGNNASAQRGSGASGAAGSRFAGRAQTQGDTSQRASFRGPGGQQGAFGRRFATIQVQATTIESLPLVTDNVTAGTVVPVTQSQVAAQSSGIVLKILHNQGDFVSAGEPVIQLDDTTLKLLAQNAQISLQNAEINLAMGRQSTTASNPKLADQLQSAQSALLAAQKNYNAQKAQYAVGGISGSALDSAKAALDSASANLAEADAALQQNTTADTQNIQQLKLSVTQAQNQLAAAQLNLTNAVIRAPFAGQIASINVSIGSFVGQNTNTFLLVSEAKEIDFTEPPTDAPNFKVGDTVQFSYGGKTYPVKITQAPSAPINGVVPMVATVPSSLQVSYGAVGTIGYKTTVAVGPQVPVSSILSQQGLNYVDIIVGGKSQETQITILAEAGSTAVVQGVKAGDQVILSPPPGLINGATVEVVSASGSQVASTSGPSAGGGTGSQQGGQSGSTRQGQSNGTQQAGGGNGSTQSGQSGFGQRNGQYSGAQGQSGSGQPSGSSTQSNGSRPGQTGGGQTDAATGSSGANQ